MDPPLPPESPSPAKLSELTLSTPTKRRLELTPGATEDFIFGGLAPSIFGPSTPDATPSPSKRRSTANEQSTAVGFPITTRQDDNMIKFPWFGASEMMSLFDSDVAIGVVPTRQESHATDSPTRRPAVHVPTEVLDMVRNLTIELIIGGSANSISGLPQCSGHSMERRVRPCSPRPIRMQLGQETACNCTTCLPGLEQMCYTSFVLTCVCHDRS